MLLEKEGTAKVVSQELKKSTANRLDYHRKKQLKYRRVKSDVGEIQGTVPYLGTFLTDLTMIDTASPDFVEDGLINFEKRRKEFDVLAQLKLFQAAARNYHLKPDSKFITWFCSLPHLTEDQCYSLSCLIEPHSIQRPI
uniref:Ras-GEF domain-containing protein n=1 Tax=Romanomermis culicivorax TaxID=13658 RepID=A0A915L8S6_ROMCU